MGNFSSTCQDNKVLRKPITGSTTHPSASNLKRTNETASDHKGFNKTAVEIKESNLRRWKDMVIIYINDKSLVPIKTSNNNNNNNNISETTLGSGMASTLTKGF
jgi:hypothetical protein